MEQIRVLKAPKNSRFSEISVVEEVTSTNSVLLGRCFEPRCEAQVLVAMHQTQGRGRQGRSWIDEPGNSLLMSSMFRNSSLELGLVPLLVGMALKQLAESHIDEEIDLKWPNDILISDKKLAGILVEAKTRGSETWVVIGTGVNRFAPQGDGFNAASFADYGEPPLLDDLIVELVAAIDEKLTWGESVPSAVIAQSYERACSIIGKTIRASGVDGAEVVGLASGIDPTGALIVDEDGVGLTTFAAGEVHLEAIS